MFDKCNCGKEARYFHLVNGEDVVSCNKYKICPPYEELEHDARKYKKLAWELIDIANDLSMYRDGTKNYKDTLIKLVDIEQRLQD